MSERNFQLVVIAASAGGVEALSRILSELPATFPLAIAIVQHRSLAVPNLLSEVLQRHSRLRVKTAEDGEPIVPGLVYVAPPGIHLLVDAAGRFALRDGIKVKHVRPSGDVLFISAAEALGTQVIALVLTGGDGDGSDGIRVVKDRGGTVVCQNEGSSKVPSMPRAAIATGYVDYVLPLEDIASALITLAGLSDTASDLAMA